MSESWSVEWWDDSLLELSELLASSHDRIAITQAIATAQHMLSDDPERKGIHLSEGLRRLNVSPILVYFEIDATERLIRIVSVKRVSS